MYQSYVRSEEAYIEETNIVNIINSIRQLKVLMKLILTQNQLKIIEFANYKNPHQRCDNNTSIVESIMATNPMHRFDEMCHKLKGTSIFNEILEIYPLSGSHSYIKYC